MSDPPLANAPRTSGDAAATVGEQSPQGKDLSPRWRKIEILGRPVSAFITALVVAAIGFIGQNILADRETNITKRAAREQLEITRRAALEQDTRVYTELMSRREQADSELRRDMFTTILGEFLKPIDRNDGGATIKARLLKLELLALNFGDSLSLNPLFLELEEAIVAFEDDPAFRSDPFWKVETNEMQTRLQSLARRVSVAQLAALTPAGTIFEFDVPLNRVTGGKRHSWPDDDITDLRDYNKENDECWVEDPNWAAGERGQRATLELRGIERTYKATFSEASVDQHSVLVELEIAENPRNGALVAMRPTEMSFELNFFNFPMIDNTRLSSNQRFALLMEKFDDENIHVVGISFPGMYASLRDKPFMDDVIANLKEQNDALGAPATAENGEEP